MTNHAIGVDISKDHPDVHCLGDGRAARDDRATDHPVLSIGAQCRLLSISRSSFCSRPQNETGTNLSLMLLIDKQFLGTPFYGVRQMTWHLRKSARPWPQWGRASPKTATR